jgi:hypothetical protein
VSRLTPSFIVASLAGLALSLTPVRPVQAATLTVCGIGCDHTTIAAAIAAASAGDTISVMDAVHTEAGISVTKNLTIQGQGAASTTVDGGGSGPVFTVSGGVIATIQNMTISNGFASGGGDGEIGIGTRGQAKIPSPPSPFLFARLLQKRTGERSVSVSAARSAAISQSFTLLSG